MTASGNASEPGSSPTVKQRAMAAAAPAWRQFVVNLRIWAPYFSNRIDRERLVRFSAAEERVSLKWTASMPKQCWSCGSEAGLAATEFRRLVRAYENPLAILSATAAGAGIGLLLLVLSPGVYTLLLLLAVVAIGLAILRLKSWVEDVRLVFWSCPEHAAELQTPELAIDDQQLCVFSPTMELAQEARVAIRAKRKRGLKPYDETGGQSNEEPAPTPARSRRSPAEVEEPPSYQPPQPVDLPPIRLAGEDDDTPT